MVLMLRGSLYIKEDYPLLLPQRVALYYSNKEYKTDGKRMKAKHVWTYVENWQYDAETSLS